MDKFINMEIYNNFKNDGNYTAKWKREMFRKNLHAIYIASGLTGDKAGELTEISKQALSNFCSGKTQKDFCGYFTYASLMANLLQNKYNDDFINKIIDIIFCNTDKYSEDQINNAYTFISVLRDDNAYNQYKSIVYLLTNIL